MTRDEARDNYRNMVMDAIMDLEAEAPQRNGFSALEIMEKASMKRWFFVFAIGQLKSKGLVVELKKRAGKTKPAALWRMARTHRTAARSDT